MDGGPLNSTSVVDLVRMVCSMVQSVAVLESAALLSLLLMPQQKYHLDEINVLTNFTAIDNRFPLDALNTVEKPAAQTKDSSENEDRDEDDDDSYDDADEDDSFGEESEDDEDESDETNSGGESDDEDEDADDADDDDDNDVDSGDEEDDESDDDDEEEEAQAQPPSKQKK